MLKPELRNTVLNINDKVYLAYIKGRLFFIQSEKVLRSPAGLLIAFVVAASAGFYYSSLNRQYVAYYNSCINRTASFNWTDPSVYCRSEAVSKMSQSR